MNVEGFGFTTQADISALTALVLRWKGLLKPENIALLKCKV
jgi:hypothetical protein